MFGLSNLKTESGVQYAMYMIDVPGLTQVRLRSLPWYLSGLVS